MVSTTLHWSFNYANSKNGGESFRNELLACLQEVYTDGYKNATVRDYTVLPNHWRGYANRLDEPPEHFAFGEARIEREKIDDGYSYAVRYYNDASGEDLRLVYETDDTPLRQLRGAWSVQVKNSAGDIYKAFECDGLRKDNEILLTVNGQSFCAGTVPDDVPLLCNWTLFDVILALYESGRNFAVLEDLEKPKRNCRVRPLGSWAHGDIRLQGFALQGKGQVQTCYWFDDAGNTAVMSNAFNTFVLSCMGGDK